MHVKLMTFHTIAVLSLVFASVECNPSGTAYAQSADREDDHEAFNLLLDSIKTHPLREQFSALESFVEDHSEFARGYHTLLDWYIFHDNIQAAKIIFRKRADNPKYARNSRWMLAKIFISENDLDAAYAAFGQALSIASPSFALLRDFVEFDHQQADSDDGAVILEELDLNPDTVRIVSAFQSYYGSKFQQAITLFEKAPRQISHDPTILNTWGYCCHYMSSFSQADSLWRIGVEISNRAGDMRARGRFLLRLGFSQGNRRKYDTALAYYDSAYAVVRLANDLHLMQNLAGYKAYIYRFRGEYSEAEEQFKQAIDISLKTGNIRSLSNWYRGYAMMQYYIGRYQDALTNIDIGEAYARKSNLAGFLVSTKVDKASIYSTLKQDALARQTLQEALELTKINELRYYEKWTKANLGEIWLRAGEFSKARENFIEFIDYLNETDNPRERLYWVGTIAESYELEGQYLLAKEVYQQAFAAAKEADSKKLSRLVFSEDRRYGGTPEKLRCSVTSVPAGTRNRIGTRGF